MLKMQEIECASQDWNGSGEARSRLLILEDSCKYRADNADYDYGSSEYSIR